MALIALALVGVLVIVAGLALLSVPAAVIAVGVSLVAAAYLIAEEG
jgi:hypothetical protein